MNDNVYIIIIIILTVFILLFGGHNNQTNIIEYESKYFENLNSIIMLEKKLNKNVENIIFDSNNFVNINKYLISPQIIIPNFVNCFYILIKPYELFNIFKIINKNDIYTSMMILFNHKKYNNLELLIDNSSNNLYKQNFTNIPDILEHGYFYDLEKIISITGIYHIYNNSNENIIITCFILKKPFWFI